MPDEKKSATINGKKIKNDIILVSVLACIILFAILGILLFREEGDTVSVTVDGEIYGTYSLSKNAEIEIKSDLGTNVLVIKDGTAHVEYATCPDGICSAHRPIRYSGESIICLPNKVVVAINKQDDNQPDIIV